MIYIAGREDDSNSLLSIILWRGWLIDFETASILAAFGPLRKRSIMAEPFQNERIRNASDFCLIEYDVL